MVRSRIKNKLNKLEEKSEINMMKFNKAKWKDLQEGKKN